MDKKKEKEIYTIKMPRIMAIVLSVSSYYRKSYFNTNDIAILSNRYRKDVIRLRRDKKDYKFGQDTNLGGIRGNLATFLTWRGIVRRDNRIINTYGIGRDSKIINAINSSRLILDLEKNEGHTHDQTVYKLLSDEVKLRSIRESQAHIKVFIENNPDIKIERDNEFKKTSVVVANGVYFLRAIVNSFVDKDRKIIEYRIIDLWTSKKLKQVNIHMLFVLPKIDDYWAEIFAISIEDLWETKPALITINTEDYTCIDDTGKKYTLKKFDEATSSFSTKNENIDLRLNYNSKEILKRYEIDETKNKEIKESEFSIFTKKFLQWQPNLNINGKRIKDIIESSSGGADVILEFEDGSKRKLELEHDWINYLDHSHHRSNAWANCWLYAGEEWDFEKIKNIFSKHVKKEGVRIPTTFLTTIEGERKIFEVDWANKKVSEIPVSVF